MDVGQQVRPGPHPSRIDTNSKKAGRQDISLGVKLNFSPETSTHVLALQPVAENASAALQHGISPILIEGCTGGAYYLRSPTHRISAVFKPQDEEAYAPNNPKAYTCKTGLMGIKHGVRAGESAIRECVAYLVDHRHFAGVPATTMATAFHPTFYVAKDFNKLVPKVGSLQEYCAHECSAEDMGSANFPVEQVHAIGILDIRLCNQDRHPGNILLRYDRSNAVDVNKSNVSCRCAVRPRIVSDGNERIKPSFNKGTDSEERGKCNRIDTDITLIPIDHGCCLPDFKALDETNFAWLDWRQSHLPFNTKSLEYIQNLNSWEDEKLIKRSIGDQISRECMLTLHLCTALLKLCASAGFSLHVIGSLMCRDYVDKPCPLEQLIEGVTSDYHDVQAFVSEFENLVQVEILKNKKSTVDLRRASHG